MLYIESPDEFSDSKLTQIILYIVVERGRV